MDKTADANFTKFITGTGNELMGTIHSRIEAAPKEIKEKYDYLQVSFGMLASLFVIFVQHHFDNFDEDKIGKNEIHAVKISFIQDLHHYLMENLHSYVAEQLKKEISTEVLKNFNPDKTQVM